MKKIGINPLFCLLAILLFSCNTTKNSTTSATNQPETVVVAPVVVNPDVSPEGNPAPSEHPEEVVSAADVELDMINEINSLRKDPSAYIPRIQEYLAYYEREGFPDVAGEKSAAQNLISELKNMPALTQVKYDQQLYKVAQKHGKELRRTGNNSNPHINSAGQDHAKRIEDGTGLTESAENFGGFHANPRYQLISLLVDSGVAGQGHRKNILDPRWDVVACFDIGQVGDADDCWLQLFAKEGSSPSNNTNLNNNTSTLSLSDATSLVAKATYMSAREREMLNEINLLRADPKSYIQHIEAYKERVKKGEVFTMVSTSEELSVADGLITELKIMAPLSLLKPDQKLYNVAVGHGQFLKQKGNIDINTNPHAGRNNEGADARIKAGAGMSAGGENYAGAASPSIRETVISLLVDSGIPGFGHRRTLLDPEWEYGVCHNFGKVSTSQGIDIEDNWLQNYGKK